MNVINMKFDIQMKWLGLLVVSLLIIITATLVVYYNLIPDTYISLLIGTVLAVLFVSVYVKKVGIKNE